MGKTGIINKLLNAWGMIFRTLFIISIALIAWFWIDPKSIADIPLAKLTLRNIFKPLFPVAVTIGCAWWFFSFPNKYEKWGKIGAFITVCTLLVWTYFRLKT